MTHVIEIRRRVDVAITHHPDNDPGTSCEASCTVFPDLTATGWGDTEEEALTDLCCRLRKDGLEVWLPL